MTAIAWDGETLAADRMLSCNSLMRTVRKVFVVRDGIMGFSGDISICMEFMAWYNDGASPKEFPHSLRDVKELPVNALVINNATIFSYDCSPHPLLICDKHMALGSGRDFAITAMHLGHSAIKSVQIANELSNTCGNGVEWLRLDGSGGTIK